MVRNIATGCEFFVVRAYPSAFLSWPARQVEVNVWDYDLEATELTWKVATSFEHFVVIPTKYTAPLRMFLIDCAATLGVYQHVKGLPVTVLAAQTDRGFAGMSEALLKKLIEQELHMESPAATSSDEGDIKLDMVVQCMSQVKPALTVADVNAALARAFQIELPDVDCLWTVDSNLILDALTQFEAKDVKEYYGDVGPLGPSISDLYVYIYIYIYLYIDIYVYKIMYIYIYIYLYI